MGATLAALLHLQQVEDQLRSLRDRIAGKRRSVQVRQKRVTQLEHQSAEIHAAIRKLQADADRLELDRRTKEEHAGRLKEALNRTKSNKDYAAILTQMNTEKADILKIEDAVLIGLGKVDEQKNQEKALQAQLVAEQAQVAELTKAADAVAAELSGQLSHLEAQRAAAAASVPPSVLALFERAAEKHEGEALAPLERTHPKRSEFVCGGCRMGVPLDMANSLRSGDAVHQCHSCGRILYLEDSTVIV